jgi:cbb3-type cytochrome oxidase cytochrome c subunit
VKAPAGLEKKQIIALIAYLQKLGSDIKVVQTAKLGAN